mmetsp:Transcript_9827/g.14128  ORF Transcript_9827/g.14128 Transcript_9827/m.14128 type:complete len:84 (-) Transcript_9827:118-369(-)
MGKVWSENALSHKFSIMARPQNRGESLLGERMVIKDKLRFTRCVVDKILILSNSSTDFSTSPSLLSLSLTRIHTHFHYYFHSV